MPRLPYTQAGYHTPSRPITGLANTFPLMTFYSTFIATIVKAGLRVKQHRYTTWEWCRSSLNVLSALERIGVCFEITGFKHLEQLDTPCVVVGNHMSTLETVVLPGLILPIQRVAFIVKDTLLNYPIFGDVLRAIQPIVVKRTNPRQDFKTVMRQGCDRLRRGISIIVFPQTTRFLNFNPSQFNTLGVKLALRANVPIVPLALLTDAWRNGTYVKDIGPIDPSKKVFFAFGKPLWPQGRGKEEHHKMLAFIQRKFEAWQTGNRAYALE